MQRFLLTKYARAQFIKWTLLLSFTFLCSVCGHKSKETHPLHPWWHHLNKNEDELPEDRCKITRLGNERFRFHVANNQKYFNNDQDPRDQKKFVTTDNTAFSWILTPHAYGKLTSEHFPKTLQTGLKYRYRSEQGGLPEVFLEELLAIQNNTTKDYKKATIILSTGMEGNLGVSKALESALKKKKEKGVIRNYYICPTPKAVKIYNRHIKKREEAFIFVHTIG